MMDNVGDMDNIMSIGGLNYPDSNLQPTSVQVKGGVAVIGDNVLLHPKVRADAFDMMLDGKTARIEGFQQDYEERYYVIVTLDDDPGREQMDERVMPGHRFFFFPEEVELLKDIDIPWREA